MYRVVVVDDEPWALRGYENIVRWNELGYEICSLCISPTDALNKIETLAPDLVITDIRMPGMTGLQLINACKTRGCKCEFLVVSGFDDFFYVQEAMNLGAFYYMLKPVGVEELTLVLSRLKERLDRNRSEKAWQSKQLLRDIYISENRTATFRQLFLPDEGEARWNGFVVLQESELDQLPMSVFRPISHYLSLRVTTHLTAYFLISPENAENSMDPDVFEAAVEMGVEFYASEQFLLDSPVNDAVRSAEKALDAGTLLRVRNNAEEISSEIPEKQPLNKDIQKIVDYIQAHYTEQLSLERISSEFHFSFSYICHMFKRETGVTFLEYLTDIRMKRACELLRTTDLEVRKIAAMVGYSDYYYFCRIFKKKYDCRPSGMRKAGDQE